MIDAVPPTDELLAGLTPAQRRAVTTDAAPLCILAGAGAGKTRVLTRRIAYRVATGTADAPHVLALTFTRKAAGELAGRLRATGLRDRVATGTFHAVAAAQLRRWWADRGQPAPTLLDRKARILAPILTSRPGLAGLALADVAAQIEWAKARLVAPAGFEAAARAAGRALPAPADQLAALYARYEDEKVRRGVIDFDDLLVRCAEIVERDPAFGAAQRWRWRHVFVDEFQDVNPLQHRLLLAWLGERVDVCIVGDPNQAIYGWNGADPRLLDDVPDRWPTTEVVRLDANHRCSPQIVAAAAAVLGEAGAGLTSSRPDGPEVTVRSWPSADAEAHGIAASVRAARAEGVAWSQCAVLVRTNAQAVVLAEACRAAAIPVRTPGGAALLTDPVARHALDDLARRPGVAVRSAAADLDRWAEPGQAGALLQAVGAGADGGDDDAVRHAQTLLGALAELARHAERIDPAMTVGAWLGWLPAALGRDADSGGEAVTVSSFHRAKGLEWSAVWVAGLEVGLVPIGRATTAAAEAEERRLLYVALTRAGRSLTCSWAEERSFGGRPVRRQPTPWLRHLRTTTPGEAHAAPTADEWQRRLAAQRERLRDAGRRRRPSSGAVTADLPAPDPAVLAALRSWRAEVARASAVPAHVVLHDSVLTLLAALRPTDHAGLLALPGVGPIKADRFGPTLLALVAERAVSA